MKHLNIHTLKVLNYNNHNIDLINIYFIKCYLQKKIYKIHFLYELEMLQMIGFIHIPT